MILTFGNDGKKLVETNYWESCFHAQGAYVVSLNDGCFRLLLPRNLEPALDDMRACDFVVITRGTYMGRESSFEIMFEDHSQEPFSFHSGPENWMTMPDHTWEKKRNDLYVYTRDGLALELPCYYRTARKLPYMKPYFK